MPYRVSGCVAGFVSSLVLVVVGHDVGHGIWLALVIGPVLGRVLGPVGVMFGLVLGVLLDPVLVLVMARGPGVVIIRVVGRMIGLVLAIDVVLGLHIQSPPERCEWHKCHCLVFVCETPRYDFEIVCFCVC